MWFDKEKWTVQKAVFFVTFVAVFNRLPSNIQIKQEY